MCLKDGGGEYLAAHRSQHHCCRPWRHQPSSDSRPTGDSWRLQGKGRLSQWAEPGDAGAAACGLVWRMFLRIQQDWRLYPVGQVLLHSNTVRQHVEGKRTL
ncbi:uncharacterized protein LOC127860500 [Dreissena polymorpha]|uniref:uncharacterized protein LOC127860500 n=1 Tax=Dreissena polymorpha TaxID=45954 RepID=UPI0022640803|nr:uncharacterized protein LOC127860500 [Dreissena polymorpha]